MIANKEILVKGINVRYQAFNQDDYICLTDIAKVKNSKEPKDVIKDNLIVPNLTKEQINFIYANEVNLLNVALFGKTAGEWKNDNPNQKFLLKKRIIIMKILILILYYIYNLHPF